MRLLAASLLPLLLSSACATLPGAVEEPEVEVQGVRVDAVSFTGLEGQIDLDVFNPNGFGVPLERCEWTLAVGGARAVSGRFDLTETIPARQSAPVVATLRMDARDAARVASLLAAGERRYRLTGRLRFSTRHGALTVDFAHEGHIEDAASAIGSVL